MLIINEESKNKVTVFDEHTLNNIGEIVLDFNASNKLGLRKNCIFKGLLCVVCSYDNTVRIVDTQNFRTVETVNVGKYPVDIYGDEGRLYVACGDSNSLWIIDQNFEVQTVIPTVSFPMYICVFKEKLYVCGFETGILVEYDKNSLCVNEFHNICGYPFGIGCVGEDVVVAYNSGNRGFLWTNKNIFELKCKINSFKVFNNRLFGIADDRFVCEMDSEGKVAFILDAKGVIADFAVNEESIVVSMLMSNEIKKYSPKGLLLGSILTSSCGNSLTLL